MAKRKVTYKEPAGYFNADMRRAAEEWEKNKKKEAQAKQTSEKSKKK